MKQKCVHGIKNDRNGGIVGLPLQLLIIVVVASLSLALILGWMNNIETPKSIGSVQCEPGMVQPVYEEGNYVIENNLKITVFDQDGNPLEGATVVLTGMGIKTSDGSTPYCVTDGNGNAVFKGLVLNNHSITGFINVEVSKPGYGENSSCKITVVTP